MPQNNALQPEERTELELDTQKEIKLAIGWLCMFNYAIENETISETNLEKAKETCKRLSKTISDMRLPPHKE